MKFKLNKWFILFSAIIVPGSGHVMCGKPVRGLVYVFWILSMGYISWMITDLSVNFVLRSTGGLLVWIASVAEMKIQLIERKNHE
ncbi:MAG: hypothetical protein C0604_02155 [Clostridiales bacterium]|nr:MAG: hypothetical protein C0604_02155 [Clostridiales bacterium]